MPVVLTTAKVQHLRLIFVNVCVCDQQIDLAITQLDRTSFSRSWNVDISIFHLIFKFLRPTHPISAAVLLDHTVLNVKF